MCLAALSMAHIFWQNFNDYIVFCASILGTEASGPMSKI